MSYPEDFLGNGPDDTAGYSPGALMARPKYRRVHGALHRLWTKAHDHSDYDKSQWKELDEAIQELAR